MSEEQTNPTEAQLTAAAGIDFSETFDGVLVQTDVGNKAGNYVLVATSNGRETREAVPVAALAVLGKTEQNTTLRSAAQRAADRLNGKGADAVPVVPEGGE